MKTDQNEYRKTSTMGMSQLDLILSVYKGAINYVVQTKTDFQEANYSSGRTACEKARKCIVHLYTTLDMDKGEQIADYLGQLYAYIIKQLDLAVASKSQEQLDDVLNVLNTLKDGWNELKVREGKATSLTRSKTVDTTESGEDGDESAQFEMAGSGGITISA